MNEINEIRSEKILSCVVLKINDIKIQIQKYCNEWISLFSIFLVRKTEGLIKHFYSYVILNSER